MHSMKSPTPRPQAQRSQNQAGGRGRTPGPEASPGGEGTASCDPPGQGGSEASSTEEQTAHRPSPRKPLTHWAGLSSPTGRVLSCRGPPRPRTVLLLQAHPGFPPAPALGLLFRPPLIATVGQLLSYKVRQLNTISRFFEPSTYFLPMKNI